MDVYVYKNLKVWERTWRKLKLAAVKRGVSMTVLVDELADQETARQSAERPTPPANQERA
ncbi:MAG: hypothetical protein WC657_07095 [Candidatus Paceibacterota bacterium]|jgi:hypothetical protein